MTENASPTVTPHDNSATLQCSELMAIDYNFLFTVSENQPYTNPPTFNPPSSPGADWVINYTAGRHNTQDVATVFVGWSGGNTNVFSPGSSQDHAPSMLNFAFGTNCTFQINGISYVVPVYFGQGHFSGGNNWWIGSPNINNNYSNDGAEFDITLQDGSSRVYILHGGISSFTFNIFEAGNAASA